MNLHQFKYLWAFALLTASGASCAAQQTSLPAKPVSFEFVSSATVIRDQNNQINETDDVKAIGEYKALLRPSEVMAAQSATQTPGLFVVKNRLGKYGLTNKHLSIKYVNGVNPDEIISDYGLSLVGRLDDINRVTILVDDLSQINQLQQQLATDNRIISTELDVMYAQPKSQ